MVSRAARMNDEPQLDVTFDMGEGEHIRSPRRRDTSDTALTHT